MPILCCHCESHSQRSETVRRCSSPRFVVVSEVSLNVGCPTLILGVAGSPFVIRAFDRSHKRVRDDPDDVRKLKPGPASSCQ